jgi:adenylate kinase
MMTIEHVTREINRILTAIGAVEPHAPKPAVAAKSAKKTAASPSKPAARARKEPAKKLTKTAKRITQAARKDSKVAVRGAKKPVRKSAIAKGGKSPKKVTKKRAKR